MHRLEETPIGIQPLVLNLIVIHEAVRPSICEVERKAWSIYGVDRCLNGNIDGVNSLSTIQPIRVKILLKKMLFYADYYPCVLDIAWVVGSVFMRFLSPRTIFSIPIAYLAWIRWSCRIIYYCYMSKGSLQIGREIGRASCRERVYVLV